MSLQEFIDFCKSCNNTDVIYEKYYSDAELIDLIYKEGARLGADLSNTPEPMRASLIAIGLHYEVQILIDW